MRLIDLYIYRVVDGRVSVLLLHRAAGLIYSGQWRMVGGKVEEGESSWQAALREMDEETGLRPLEFWALPSVNQFYDAGRDCVHTIPAFAARVEADAAVRLDEEHSAHRWVSPDDASRWIGWPEQVRLITLLGQIVERDGILPQWRIETG